MSAEQAGTRPQQVCVRTKQCGRLQNVSAHRAGVKSGELEQSVRRHTYAQRFGKRK